MINNNVWKQLAITSLSVIILMGGFWMSYGSKLMTRAEIQSITPTIEEIRAIVKEEIGKGIITRTEVEKIMQEQSPWMKDKSGVDARLVSIDMNIAEIKTELIRARLALTERSALDKVLLDKLLLEK